MRVLLLLALTCGQSVPPGAADPASLLTHWAEPGRCGGNSLYVLMRYMSLTGQFDKPFTYETISGLLPAARTPAGCSMADLQSAARQHGLELECRKIVLDDLGVIPCPFIAHLDLIDRGGTGHFVTVYKVMEKTGSGFDIDYIDTATAELHHAASAQFAPLFTGFVLVPTASRISRASTLWDLRFVLAVVAVILLCRLGATLFKSGANQAV